jgi:hypothetical protein
MLPLFNPDEVLSLSNGFFFSFFFFFFFSSLCKRFDLLGALKKKKKKKNFRCCEKERESKIKYGDTFFLQHLKPNSLRESSRTLFVSYEILDRKAYHRHLYIYIYIMDLEILS